MNDSKATGMMDEAKGKLEQAFGNATGNEKVANEGAADEVKGHAEQTWGSVKDTAHDISQSNSANDTSTEAHDSGQNMRDKVTSGAQHLKEDIQHGLNNLKQKSNE
jgi:uncharacterized protein YjbJ (UPF0337 family)